MAKKVLKNKELKKVVIDALLEKKGNDVVCLDLTKIKDTVTDYFIISHGDSAPQVRALYENVLETAKEEGYRPWRSEGSKNAEWSIIDYGNIVVHIFHRDKRAFYNLEELWSDGAREEFDDSGKKVKKKKK